MSTERTSAYGRLISEHSVKHWLSRLLTFSLLNTYRVA